MEGTSSGEEVVVKARKPYTMTKQRERWTEEEHNRFLESLKLYGRAWQRIEEHIGTKTAVQIRSHAQKFFSKLEKEAITKGVPLGKALDIEIPPPRPKRKPCGPYPRKTGVGFVSPCVEQVDNKAVKSASSPSNDKQPLHKEINEPQDSPSPCISSVTQPSSASMKEKIVMDKSCLCTDLNKKLENSFHLAKPSEKQFPSMKDKKQEGDQNQETYTSSEMPSIHPPFPAFTPFTQFQTALLQNPAVNPAASFWLPVDVGSSNESSLKIRAEEIPVRHINPCPSMAAVATATVAAASAWWTTQGLLPLFPPLHPGFAFATVPTTVVPIMESDASERAHMACFTELKNSDKLISKRTDRSSGGSNIPSSSEVETDVRRSRSSGNINESWKEVSEEGRVAFQELFARDVLPQSFSPQIEENRCGKLKVCRTGFTPYKRCSVESDGIRASAGEETGSKRMHLEGEAST